MPDRDDTPTEWDRTTAEREIHRLQRENAALRIERDDARQAAAAAATKAKGGALPADAPIQGADAWEDVSTWSDVDHGDLLCLERYEGDVQVLRIGRVATFAQSGTPRTAGGRFIGRVDSGRYRRLRASPLTHAPDPVQLTRDRQSRH